MAGDTIGSAAYELTARQDRAAAGSIASLEVSMTPLADEVARLRGIGRDALTHVTQGDSGRLEADLAAGLAVLERAGSTVEGIRVVLAELPAGSARFGLSELDQERLAAVETVVAAVASLDETWRRVAPSDPGAAARVDEAVLAVESTGGAVEEARQALAGPAP